jgi:hexosaminidase
VTSDTGLIEIGDGGDPAAGGTGCAGNTIHGGLQLASNQGVIEVGGNQISGPMIVSDSISRPSVLVGAGLEIEGNRISGPLACTNNTAAPTDGGQPNAVSGPRSGQCAAADF